MNGLLSAAADTGLSLSSTTTVESHSAMSGFFDKNLFRF
jgi:hypothetical protein